MSEDTLSRKQTLIEYSTYTVERISYLKDLIKEYESESKKDCPEKIGPLSIAIDSLKKDLIKQLTTTENYFANLRNIVEKIE